MSYPRTGLFVLLFMLLAVSSQAVTIVQNEVLFKGDDPRLEKKVSFDAEGKRLIEVLSSLTESTGVELNAGQDKNDWLVYDRKVIIHVKDMTLRALLQELATVLRFHWSRGGEEGKWSYRIWQDKQQREEEESLFRGSEDEKARQFREKRENSLADIANLGSLSATDAAALKADNPWRYVLATQPLGKDVAAFFDSFAEARNAFIQGHEATFAVSQLPQNVQGMVRRIADSYDSLEDSIGAAEDHSGLLSRFDKLQVTINRRSLSGGDDILSRSLLGRISIGSGSESFEIPLFDPSSPMAKALGRAIVALQGGATKDMVGNQLKADLKIVVEAGEQSTHTTRDTSSDPALRRSVALFDVAVNAPLPMTLKALAEKANLNVVSDYFPGVIATISGGEKTLGDQLEAISASYGSNWTKNGGIIQFRDKEWYKKRSWDVPEDWINYWSARGKKNEGLQFIDLVQIGCLRDDQIDHTVMTNPVLVTYGAGEAARNRHILRFYGSLKPDQQKLMATQRLMVSALDVTQWRALQDALAKKGVVYTAATQASQFLRISSSADGNENDITYYPNDTDPAVQFKVETGMLYGVSEGLNVVPEDKIKPTVRQ